MFCPHCIIKDYDTFCKCSQTGDNCYFVRRCVKEKKWKPLESQIGCRMRDDVLNKNIRFEKKGILYVDYKGQVVKIPNPYNEVPKSVELVEIDNELYIKGFEPKIKQKSKNNKEKE